jgi:uncharacterized protein YcnI
MNVQPGGWRRLAVCVCVIFAGLVAAASASAHARISPPVPLSNTIQLYSLTVPTEQANLTTTEIVLSVPEGFSINSFAPSPGWHRVVGQSIAANGGVLEKVTWTGGDVPTGEDSLFQFLGDAASNGTYTFRVQQTYSNGSIVDWAGAAFSPAPAPTIQAKSSLGGGATPLLAIIALAVSVAGVILGAIALLTRSGRRHLA